MANNNNNNNNKTKNIDAAFDELEHSIANKNIELSKSLENWLNTSGSSSNNTSATTNTAAADAKNKIRQDYINAGGPTTAPKPETNKRYTVGASSATGSNTGSGSNGGGVSSPLTASGVGRRQNHRMTAQPPSRQVTNTSLTDSPQLSMKKAASFNPSEKGIDGIVGGKLSVGGGEGGGGDDDEWGFFKTAVPLKNQRLSSVAPEAASSSRSRSSSAARNTLPSASDNASVGSNSVNSSRHNSPHSSRRRAERKPATADDGNYHQPDNLSSSHSSSSSAADKKRPKSSVPTAKQEFDGGNQDETVPVSDYLNVNNNYSSPSSRHSSVHRQSSKKKLVVEQQQQLQPQADFVPETADDNVEEFPTSSSTPGKPISSTSRRNTLIKPQENPISRRNTLTNKATLNAATTANPAFAEALASFRESHNVRVMKKSDSNSSSVYKGVVNGANDTTIKRASQQQQHQQEEEVEQYYKMSGIDGDNNHDDGGGRETEAGDGQLKSPVIAAVDSQANQPAKRSHNSSDGGGGGASGSLNEINSFQNELEKLSRRTDVYSNSIPHQQRQQQPQLQHLQLVTIKTPSNENMLIGNDGESAVTAKERKHASMMVMGSNKSINVSSTSIAAQNQQQPLRDSSHELLQTGAAPLPLTAKERKHTSLMIATPNRSNNNNNNNRSPHISSSNMLEQQLSFNGAPGLAVPADQASSPQTPKNRRASYVLNNKGKRVVNVNASEDFPSATPEKLYEKLKDEPSAKMTPLSKSGGQSNDSLGSRGSMLDFPVAEAIKRELQMQKSSSIVADAFEPPPYTDQQLGQSGRYKPSSMRKDSELSSSGRQLPLSKRMSSMDQSILPAAVAVEEKKNPVAYSTDSLDDIDQYFFYSNPASKEPSLTEVIIMEEDDLSPRRQTPSSDNNQDLNEYGLPKSEFEKFITKRPGAVIGSTSSLNNKKGALKRRDLEKKKKQVKPGRPWFLWIVSLIQLGVFIAEIVFNWKWGGKVISDPSVNPLIGPGVGILIQFGARFAPCMKEESNGINITSELACADSQYIPPGRPLDPNNRTICSLEDVCGMGGFNNKLPNQWWRFFTAMFIHSGLIHIGLNFSFQLRTGLQMEREMGSLRIAVIYMCSGVGGFIFSGIFSGGAPSVGCSGAIYGLIACLLLDLLFNWKLVRRPWIQLLQQVATLIVAFMIGTLPSIDNFAHVGGFFTGFICGLIFMQSLSYGTWTKRIKIALVVLGLPALVGIYYFLIKGFYSDDGAASCLWCKYFNCIPFWPWCESKWQGVFPK